ncbi:MAG: replicative DNA helicase [Clostridia bacterium]|nr:replicative DNA helicase [Clostridia bacterium]
MANAMNGKVPPHSLEAERSVLGACMRDEFAINDCMELLRAEDFYSEAHKEIFHGIVELNRDREPVDAITLSEKLKSMGVLEAVGGRAYIMTLSAEVPSVSNAKEYAKIVAEKSELRKLIRVTDEVSNKCYRQDEDAVDILDFAEQNIFEIAQDGQRKDYETINDVMRANLKQIDDAVAHRGEIRGVPTGFASLDRKLNGLRGSELVILAARPSMGKTAFALNIAANAAMEHDKSVMIFSLEMSKTQLGERLLSMEGKVEAQKLQTGEMEAKDWDSLYYATDKLSKAKLFIDDTAGITLMEMKNKCRRLKESESGLDLIIIDYLQLMSSEKSESRVQEVSALSRGLKLMAKELDCPILVLSQLSRKPDDRPNHRPMLSDLRESGSIEQDADMVIFLCREEVYDKENTEVRGLCDVDIAKNRRGETASITLTWVGRYTKFSERAVE